MSKKYFYNPTFNNYDINGDGFYTSTKNKLDDYYKKYLALKEKLKNNNIDVEDDEDDENLNNLFNNDEVENYTEDDIEDLSPMYGNYDERQVDMLTLPVYYTIVFAIPCDLSFGSETARRIEAYYGMKEKIENRLEELEVCTIDLTAGDAIKIENVITLFTTEKKYQRPTLEAIRKCARNIAEYCYEEKLRFIALPRIGCGHGHMDWDVVKEAILDEFDNYFYDIGEDEYRPYITFCYQ